jgi:hypothetical protein
MSVAPSKASVPATSSVSRHLGDPNQTQHLDAIAVERITIGWAHAVAALALAFAALWWVILAVSRGHPWGFVLVVRL